MGMFAIFLVGLSLSMDAFAVSISNGTCIKKVRTKHCLSFGLYFGIFQAGMAFIGYLLGSTFVDVIEAYDHWIAFILLGLLGGTMFMGSFSNDEEHKCYTEQEIMKASNMFSLAIATSIDALAVGVSLAAVKVNIVPVVVSIGIITFGMSWIGVYLGEQIGKIFKNNAERLGGILLILIGLNILIQHIFFG